MHSTLPRSIRWRVRLTVAALLALLVAGTGGTLPTSARAATNCRAAQTSCAAGVDSVQSAGARRQPASKVPHSAMAAVAEMQPGTNIGNTLDAIPDETSWGNPPITKALFDAIRADGFNSVRIPVTWTDHQGPGPNYTIDPVFMNRVKQVVDWALADGLYVVLNVHHDSWQWIMKMPTDHDGVRTRFDRTWTQIADTFKNHPDKLVLEAVNEPQFEGFGDAEATPLLNELIKSFHTIVRQSGGNNTTRLLELPTLGNAPDAARMDALYTIIQSLNDPRLIASVHFYGYWPFSVNIAGGTRFDDNVVQDMNTAFGLMNSKFVARGIPVVLGEYSLLSYPDYTQPASVEYGEALKYFEALGHQARINGVTTQLWDAGSFLNRETLQQRDPVLFAQLKSSWTTRSGTASSDLVFVRKSAPITDQTLTLNPNGTSFRSLKQGNTTLVQGQDYTLSGNQLTLKAAALTRLVGDRAYGVNTTLQAHFSQGVPWPIRVITNDTPVLSNATGTTDSFAVPAQFRGDLLATMEAKYADGSNAGPAEWTSYKEFNKSFSPRYADNRITLTSAFFAEVADGKPVTLTFHFWSSDTVTYQVTKSGSTVTGTTS
ncbi:cellulase family glycosylhydrolase [Streptomyces dysideae]|uniref:Cellulase n=1 Tax=Streptomyces dysideae TaxID=909626 RepID=A0A124IDX0_9ACTN|nr:cellulase family glycosylhydrolase [Streptomyces dysideae]KUO16472.1 cellulase [Streptomyces dysideae]